MLTLGIDVGSITAKAAAVKDGEVISDILIFTGYNSQSAGENLYKSIIDDLGIEPNMIDRVVSTGYGRNSVTMADKTVTEITCHAVGANHLNPAVRSVIDIGGQDSKAPESAP